MNTLFFLLAILPSAVLSTCVSAQNKPANFSGTWTLDLSASKFQNPERIESLTLKVKQNATDIEVATSLQRTPHPPAYMGGPVVEAMEQNFTNTYKLDGSETAGHVEAYAGPQPATLKAKIDAAKLQLWQLNTGDPAMNISEVWTLSKDGKLLTVERSGAPGKSSTLVFNKK
jgi:hypothetical protein